MTDEQRNEIWGYKEEFYVVDKTTGRQYKRDIELQDFAEDLIEKLSGKKVCKEFSQEEYDKWLQIIYDNYHIAVAYWYRECYELPDVENEILLGKLRELNFNK